MQTLGLASKPQPTDGIFKRLFWPEIANQYDVDLVGQQGFWVCTAVGIISMVMLVATGQPILGVFVGITYLLAGTGVRERSITAAVLIFLCYFLDRAAAVEGMFYGFPSGNPALGIAATLLLFANVRATVLSRKWRAPETPVEISELPERSSDSFTDKLANRMPAAVWPKGRYVFYPMGGLLLFLTIVGLIAIPRLQHRKAASPPTATYETVPAQ